MALTQDPQAASEVSAYLKDVQKFCKKYEETYNENEAVLKSMNDLSRNIKEAHKLTSSQRSKLSSLYAKGIANAEAEEEVLRKGLSKLYQIRKIQQEMRVSARNSGDRETIRRGALMMMLATSAKTIPMFVKSGSEQTPPLCGAIPPDANYIPSPGDMVAALVRSTDGEKSENWILAEVISYSHSSGKFEVVDIDEEQKERHLLSKRKVIPLPTKRACPETNPDALYRPGTTILAIYPQTTCFYKGVIKLQPATGAQDYQVLFEDSSYSDGYSPPLHVAQRYVIPVPDKKGRK